LFRCFPALPPGFSPGGGHRSQDPGCDSGTLLRVVQKSTTLSKGALLLSHTFRGLSRDLGPALENLLEFVGTPQTPRPPHLPDVDLQNLHLSYRRKREYIIPSRNLSRVCRGIAQNCFFLLSRRPRREIKAAPRQPYHPFGHARSLVGKRYWAACDAARWQQQRNRFSYRSTPDVAPCALCYSQSVRSSCTVKTVRR
jgi:hypothetical protein